MAVNYRRHGRERLELYVTVEIDTTAVVGNKTEFIVAAKSGGQVNGAG